MKKKKALVVGGSNGIGLAISKRLIEKGYHIYIVDVMVPDKNVLKDESAYTYIHTDLRFFDEQLFKNLNNDESIEVIMLTAGLGKVAEFEYLHISEIEKIININTLSYLKIIQIFYDRIFSQEKFYCGVMGSIAGLVSSPMFSVYAASKAAICRFVESVNVELKCKGISNRILNVSPGSLEGTRFNGGKNDVEKLEEISETIIEKMFLSNELYIPKYEEVYRRVISEYNENATEFGINSYEYKKKSGRMKNEQTAIIGYMSGTFDLFHIGHLNIIKRAKEKCDYLIVGVHIDGKRKGKETFIPYSERVEILKSIKYVDKVVEAFSEDSDAWESYKYNRLFVGSDYKGTERFNRYEEYFKDKNVEIVYFPYTKDTSSTQIRKCMKDEIEK